MIRRAVLTLVTLFTFARTGEGGTFTLDATAEGGARITGTITCERFAGIVAEGG